jgi:hypothetical protein
MTFEEFVDWVLRLPKPLSFGVLGLVAGTVGAGLNIAKNGPHTRDSIFSTDQIESDKTATMTTGVVLGTGAGIALGFLLIGVEWYALNRYKYKP